MDIRQAQERISEGTQQMVSTGFAVHKEKGRL